MKPAPFDQREHDKEIAKADCINSGVPTMGVDHSNHYKPVLGPPYTGRLTLTVYTRATKKAFGIKETNNGT